jgi:type VI secretion system secreted protein Hcp
MAREFYMTIQGTKQGKFMGESLRKHGFIPILSFNYSVSSPRDASSGQASGKRQHKPLSVVKELGASSPQFFRALTANEVLTSVVISCVEPSPDGSSHDCQTIKLKNARVSDVRGYPGPGPSTGQALQEVTFAFEELEVDGATAARIPPTHLTSHHNP